MRQGQMHKAKPSREKSELWSCPRCGRKFVNRNQWHACGRWTVDEHFANRPAWLRELFNAYLQMVRKNGPVRVHATKTRIGFIARMTFAGAMPLKNKLRARMLLPRREDLPRFRKIVKHGPRCFEHSFYIRSPDELDAELERLLSESYRLGMQEYLI